MPGNVVAHSDPQRELRIVDGASDQLAKAAIRKAGAGVVGDRADDFGLAARDEDFGDRFADRSTMRDGLKMILALGTGVGNQVGVAERFRLAENRSRHGDGVIEGKRPNQRRRRVRGGCKTACELDPGFQLDRGNEGFENLVEQLDLLFRMTAGPGDEQVGDARERPQLPLRGPGYRSGLNFADQGR